MEHEPWNGDDAVRKHRRRVHQHAHVLDKAFFISSSDAMDMMSTVRFPPLLEREDP